MMRINIEDLIRKNIRNLKPYSSARSEFCGNASVYLDANENPFGSPLAENYNRYPDPMQKELKNKLSIIKNVRTTEIFIGNGSDEVIDLAFRIFCEQGDEVIICTPTYGMYKVSASINNIAVKEIPLTSDFQLDVAALHTTQTSKTKLLFICSPNNPTGNLMRSADIQEVISNFNGIVILDEAYIDFNPAATFTSYLSEYNNLIIVQTLSKAWGLASLRLGLCFASEEIISYYNKIKPPYNISLPAQSAGMKALDNPDIIKAWVADLVQEKKRLHEELNTLHYVKKIYPSDANFILVKVDDAERLYDYLAINGVIVRNRSKELNCSGCLRITIGTFEENNKLINACKDYGKK